MAYTITLTDGTVFATINDGTVNTSSSVTLIGKNYAGYGDFLDENFIHILENFSNNSAPGAPLTGQIWWDKSNSLLKVYSGTSWKTISAATAQASAPTNNVVGDLWFDTLNQQLKVWTGAAFLVVGPAYSASQGTSGAIPETILDSLGGTKYITSLYVNNNKVGVVYDGTSFVPQLSLQATFPTIYPGITLTTSNSAIFAGTANNASYLNSLTSSQFMRADANTATTGRLQVDNNSGLYIGTSNVLNISQNSNDANVLALVSGGNLVLQANVSGTVYNSARILGSNGTFAISNAATVGTTLSATGSVTGANLLTGGNVSATGNVLGGNVIATSAVQATTATVTGNVQGGNLRTVGQVSATGNITSAGNISASYVLGNGSQLTGIDQAISVSRIANGTSEVNINGSDANCFITIAGTSNVAVFATSGAIFTNVTTPAIFKSGTNAVGNIGSVTGWFEKGYVDTVNSTILSATGNVVAGNVRTVGQVSATGNITANYFLGNGSQLSGINQNKISNGTSEVNIATTGGNANITIGGTSNVAVFATTGLTVTGICSVTGNITGGNVSAVGNVNIGTGSPVAKLTISNGTVTGYIDPFGTTILNMGTSSNHPIAITTNAAERLRMDANGNVSIGTSVNYVYDYVAAGRPLLVQASNPATQAGYSNACITISQGDTSANTITQLDFAANTGPSLSQFSSAWIACQHGPRTNGQYPTGQLIFGTSTSLNVAPSEKMRITNEGNVGIGTSSPTDTGSYGRSLDVVGTNGSALYVGQAHGTGARVLIGGYNNSGTKYGSVGTLSGGGYFDILTDGTQRIRVTDVGNVGINTTSPGSALDVKGTVRLSGSSSGYVALAPAAAAGSTTYTLPSADGSGGQVLSTNGSGTLSWASAAGTLGTYIATNTSQNYYNFTGIPSGVTSIKVIFDGVGTNNVPASLGLVQIGSGSFSITGYTSYLWENSLGINVAQATDGFLVYGDTVTGAVYGILTLQLVNAVNNTWVASMSFGRTVTGGFQAGCGGGAKTLGGGYTLDRIRLACPAPWINGGFNISYQ